MPAFCTSATSTKPWFVLQGCCNHKLTVIWVEWGGSWVVLTWGSPSAHLKSILLSLMPNFVPTISTQVFWESKLIQGFTTVQGISVFKFYVVQRSTVLMYCNMITTLVLANTFITRHNYLFLVVRTFKNFISNFQKIYYIVYSTV